MKDDGSFIFVIGWVLAAIVVIIGISNGGHLF